MKSPHSLLLIFLVAVLAACTANPALAPLAYKDLPMPSVANELSIADATQKGVFISPYALQGVTVSGGTFNGYNVENKDGAITGLHIYLIPANIASSLKDFYGNELGKNHWQYAEEIRNKDASGYAWMRGNQVFAFVQAPSGGKALTYIATMLLNKK